MTDAVATTNNAQDRSGFFGFIADLFEQFFSWVSSFFSSEGAATQEVATNVAGDRAALAATTAEAEQNLEVTVEQAEAETIERAGDAAAMLAGAAQSRTAQIDAFLGQVDAYALRVNLLPKVYFDTLFSQLADKGLTKQELTYIQQKLTESQQFTALAESAGINLPQAFEALIDAAPSLPAARENDVVIETHEDREFTRVKFTSRGTLDERSVAAMIIDVARTAHATDHLIELYPEDHISATYNAETEQWRFMVNGESATVDASSIRVVVNSPKYHETEDIMEGYYTTEMHGLRVDDGVVKADTHYEHQLALRGTLPEGAIFSDDVVRRVSQILLESERDSLDGHTDITVADDGTDHSIVLTPTFDTAGRQPQMY